jgi:hypothetical protein
MNRYKNDVIDPAHPSQSKEVQNPLKKAGFLLPFVQGCAVGVVWDTTIAR